MHGLTDPEPMRKGGMAHAICIPTVAEAKNILVEGLA